MYKYLEHYDIMKTAVQDIPNIEEILAVGETALEDLILPNEVNMEGMQNIRSWKSRITKEEILLDLEYEEINSPFHYRQKIHLSGNHRT